MSLVSEIWTVENEGRLYSCLTTNVGTDRFLAFLKVRGILESVETVHEFLAGLQVSDQTCRADWGHPD